jgi:hypothetical protein
MVGVGYSCGNKKGDEKFVPIRSRNDPAVYFPFFLAGFFFAAAFFVAIVLFSLFISFQTRRNHSRIAQ